jgi:hypothetical protein
MGLKSHHRSETLSPLLAKVAMASMVGIASLCNNAPEVSAAPAADETYTYTVCYFTKGSERKWEWGLKSDNGWYKLYGTWEKTRDTRIMKFWTKASRTEIQASCMNSQNYYKLRGYTLDKIFAADSARGSNYPIVTPEGEINQ